MGNARIQIFHWRVGSYEKWLPISVIREWKCLDDNIKLILCRLGDIIFLSKMYYIFLFRELAYEVFIY